MMGKIKIQRVICFIFSLFAFCFSLSDCFAQSAPSSELIFNAKQYSGKIVLYQGEVVGEVMKRGNYSWVNIADSKNAIGVWLDNALTQKIVFTGSYKSRGDVVEVIGIFHRACPQHGGDLDIHAQSIRKISPGYKLFEKISPIKIQAILTFAAILLLLWILNLLKHK